MGSAPITAGFLLTSLAVVALLEVSVAQLGAWMQLPRLWLLFFVRTTQLAAILALAAFVFNGWHALGLDKKTLLAGLKKGLIWSTGFAVTAGLLFLGLIIAGQDPFMLIRMPLPPVPSQRALFFFVGGIVAPIAEEVVFRGLIFGYLRRWGLTAAVLISTALFAALHLPTIPVTQVVGGAVFAIAYHMGGSLMVPIVIHMLGNLAIFTLSLPFFRGF
jgi:uncharacterized protein